MGLLAGRARYAWLAMLIVAATLPGAAVAQEQPADGDGSSDRSSFGSQIRDLKKAPVPGKIIVRYDEGAGPDAQAAVRREEGVVKKADLDFINADVVKAEEGAVAAAIEDLEANPDVEYAVRDRWSALQPFSKRPPVL